MGSQLSPVVANLYMEAFENRALQLALSSRGYGFDTWTTRSSYGLTARRSSNSSTKKGVGSSLGSTGRLYIPIGTYIQFSSHHHPRIMTGVVRRLKQRADSICDIHSLKPT